MKSIQTNKNKLLRTNLLISIILIAGFVTTAVFSYRANYQVSLNNIEQVSSLSTEGIYYQLSSLFSKPVNISLTMAHDSLLVEHLMKEPSHLADKAYEETTKEYLKTYREKYGFDSVFLVSTVSGRYYNFNGVDRVMERDNPENTWYFDMLDSNKEYSLNVDNDEVSGADNKITTFVNCRIQDTNGAVIGIVGVGIRMDYIKELLQNYEDTYNVKANLINENGEIEISTSYTGYEAADWFEIYGQEGIRDQILSWYEDTKNLELWTNTGTEEKERSFVVSRYIPELSWMLIVEQDTGRIIQEMYMQLYKTCFVLALVVIAILVIITSVIRKFNLQITKLVEERQAMFKEATEQLYDSIYELNLTKNCYVGKTTEDYFSNLGAGGVPFDQGLRIIAEKQIKEEYRKGYIEMFAPENAIREYEAGNNHLSYDFLFTLDGADYHWMRVETYLFYSEEDCSVHMFSYRKNIDQEKKKELMAQTDEMTGFLTKTATERLIEKQLVEKKEEKYAFFICDIDNFKQVNDRFGHAFGDYCICSFTKAIREHFRKDDILGRIGGDEFVVFIPYSSERWLEEKAAELSKALEIVCTKEQSSCQVSASIGISISSQAGNRFDQLYQSADAALYQTKKNGKNGFTIMELTGEKVADSTDL
ncbi:diguanylate cyclase (GGDEF)-like protein [Hungatella effluvii]|uniref:Diguanylate cyclase (GGDEF)-like protein n=1 Tax=Hungatella effluvii TaxID=1096246 RepID=A0A2V3XU34_9FIRM|nr:sensor domain-containing diguanylate cyclase [Hungatella effluvii]PXX44300.1 diguanylate cyclase (GGDEF)-like protein [Hungatella effluvii]